MSIGVWFASESGGNGIWALSESAGGLAITSITPSDTSIVVAWTGTATHYRINGGTATAMPEGTSPDTITGLIENTQYNAPGLELSPDGGTIWSDPVPFGTTNPGEGGGEIPVYEEGGGSALVDVLASGAGDAAEVSSGGGSALVDVTASGAGNAAEAGSSGGSALIEVVATGDGLEGTDPASGGSAFVGVVASGAGTAAEAAQGGGSAVVDVVARGAGTDSETAASGGSAVVAVLASGAGSGIEAGTGGGSALIAILASGAGTAVGAGPNYAEQPMTGASWSYKQTATLWALTGRDAWGGQVTHASPVLFLCDYKQEERRMVSARGDEFVSRLQVYTSLATVKQGDMVLIGESSNPDPYAAGANEVRLVNAWADTFKAEGAPDWLIAT